MPPQLGELPERALATGDPASYRLVYRDDDDNVHVASLSRGLFQGRVRADADLGDEVAVELDGEVVRALKRLDA